MVCKKCGKILEAGSSFCNNCGNKISSGTDEAQKISYEGVIKICPNCKSTLKSFWVNCPECGLELRDINVSNSIKDFYNKLEKIEERKAKDSSNIANIIANAFGGVKNKSDDEVISLIRNYVVPNTKEDITEFFILASSNIDFDVLKCIDSNDEGAGYTVEEVKIRTERSRAWITKMQQVYDKAYLTFGGDADFETINVLYLDTMKRIQNSEESKEQKKYLRQKSSMKTIIWCSIIILGIMFFMVIQTGLESRQENGSIEYNYMPRNTTGPSVEIDKDIVYPSGDIYSVIYNDVVYPPAIVYTTHADENGLDGLPCVLRGNVKKVFLGYKSFIEGMGGKYGNKKDKDWNTILLSTEYGDVIVFDESKDYISRAKQIKGESFAKRFVHDFKGYVEYPKEGEDVYILCEYEGFSDVHKLPSFSYGINEGYYMLREYDKLLQ